MYLDCLYKYESTHVLLLCEFHPYIYTVCKTTFAMHYRKALIRGFRELYSIREIWLFDCLLYGFTI